MLERGLGPPDEITLGLARSSAVEPGVGPWELRPIAGAPDVPNAVKGSGNLQ